MPVAFPRRLTVLICCAAWMLTCSCGASVSTGCTPSSHPSLPSVSLPSISVPSASSPASPSPSVSTDSPVFSVPALPEPPPPSPSPAYDFSKPAPENEPVENTYFADAAFVGDSRTDGLMLFSGIKNGANLSSNGMSVFRLATRECLTVAGQPLTLLDALGMKQYGKVYLSLGVNELGYRNDTGFYRAYCSAIDAIRACQPNAVIYVQSLIPLNEELIASYNGPEYLKNDHLMVYNDLIRQAAEEKQVVFLDVHSVFAVDGQLPAEAGKDGIHLTADGYRMWLNYLKSHTVGHDTLYSAAREVPAP